jgi:hypothetical protein
MPDIPNPLLTVFNPFLTSKSFRGQMERVVRGGKNVGFVDASFQSMMKAVGWKGGEAWCMYFCKLVYMQFFSFDREFLAKNFSGSTGGTLQNVINLNAKGDKRYIFIKSNTPQIGDIICLQGHVGLVQEVISPTVVKTIEGNTNLKGVREGEGVSENTRTLIVGKSSFGQIFKGYIRRNFSQDELNKLYFDETEKTLKFIK